MQSHAQCLERLPQRSPPAVVGERLPQPRGITALNPVKRAAMNQQMIVAGLVGEHPLYSKEVALSKNRVSKGMNHERAHDENRSDATRKPHAAPIGCESGYERNTKCDAFVNPSERYGQERTEHERPAEVQNRFEATAPAQRTGREASGRRSPAGIRQGRGRSTAQQTC